MVHLSQKTLVQLLMVFVVEIDCVIVIGKGR